MLNPPTGGQPPQFPQVPGPLPAGPPPHHAPPPGSGASAGKGCLYAVLAALALLFIVGGCGALISASGGSGPGTGSPSEPSDQPREKATKKTGEKAAEKADEKPVNGIGRQYRDGKFAFTVTKIKRGVRRVGNEYFGETAQGEYTLVHVTVRNIGDEARMFDSHNQTLIDTRGREFEADGEATIAMGRESNAFLEDINPGNSVKGILVFDAPRGTEFRAIELHDSMFSGGVTVPLGR